MKFVYYTNKELITKGYESVTNGFLLDSNIEYQSYKFDNDDDIKTYILANDTRSIFIIENSLLINAQGIINYIREERKDYQSYIIVINFNNDCSLQEFNILTTVIEGCNLPTNLIMTVKELTKMYLHDSNIFWFKQNGVLFFIPLSNIVCIEKLPNSKYIQIICKNKKYTIKDTLNNVRTKLNDNFIMVHRSVCVNIKEIETYDYVNGIIKFTNDYQTTMISRDKKKELLKVLTKQDKFSTKQGTK